MTKLKIFAGIALATLLFSSCDDSTSDIGGTLVDNMDKLTITTDTFHVSTRSIVADSVLSRNTTGYLGKVRDPETGAYITGDFMTQFHTSENYTFPDANKILSKKDGKIVADSCEIRLYYKTFYGDSLTAMKLTAYEMSKPMSENNKYYSSFNPIKEGYIREKGIKVDKTYSITNMNDPIGTRKNSDYTPNIRIMLNNEYTDKDGKTYSNYGSYIMQKYYENPDYFKNSYNFVNNVVPGFYFKNTSGLGSMAYVYVSQLNVYFKYQYNDTTEYKGTASFSGTEEVLQTTNITNDGKTIANLATDNSCTYLKTPAGIFTEMTLPIENILSGHENDTINTAKVVITRINNETQNDYSLKVPQTLLMIPEDSLYTFFENNDIANYKTSYLASFSSTNNTYTFNNIGLLVKKMYDSKAKGNTSGNWNKVVILPVTTTYDSSSILTKVVHDMSLASTRLVGGSANTHAPIKISVIYSKFK